MDYSTTPHQWDLKMEDYVLIIVLMTQPVYCPPSSGVLSAEHADLIGTGLLELIQPPGLLCLTVQGHLRIASLPRRSVLTAIEHLLNVFPEALKKHMATAKH